MYKQFIKLCIKHREIFDLPVPSAFDNIVAGKNKGEYVILPTLSQLLTMLEKKGYWQVILYETDDYEYGVEICPKRTTGKERRTYFAPTRELAALKAVIEVYGKTKRREGDE